MGMIRGRLHTFRSGTDQRPPGDSILFAETLTLEAVWVALRCEARCIVTAHGSPHSHAGIQLQALQEQLAWRNGIDRKELPPDGTVVYIEASPLSDQWSVPDRKCPLVLRDDLQVMTCMNPYRRYHGRLAPYIAGQLGMGLAFQLDISCRGLIGRDGRMWFRSESPWARDLFLMAGDPERRHSWLEERWNEYRTVYHRMASRLPPPGKDESDTIECLDHVLRNGVLLHWHYSSVIASLRASGGGASEGVRVIDLVQGPIYEWVRRVGLPQRMEPTLWGEPLVLPPFIPEPRCGFGVESDDEVAQIMDLKEWRLLLIQALISRLSPEAWSRNA